MMQRLASLGEYYMAVGRGEEVERMPVGLQGLYGGGDAGWGGAERVRKGRKWGVKSSHPRWPGGKGGVEGFSKDIIDPEDEASAPPPPPLVGRGGKKASLTTKPVEPLQPVCAACLSPLLLAQSGTQRPWALRCGHVVCGGCIGSAGERARLDKRKAAEIVLSDDEEEEELAYVGDPSPPPPPSSARAGKRKATGAAGSHGGGGGGKGEKKAKSTDVDRGWTSCPIVVCSGDRTDLTLVLGGGGGEGAGQEDEWRGAWELFV